jgi:hypothetical protein
MLWFTLVFLVLLKIPLAYLAYVVWWAVKSPPEPGEGYEGTGSDVGSDGPSSGSPWWKPPVRDRRGRRGPHGTPARRPAIAGTRARSKVVE